MNKLVARQKNLVMMTMPLNSTNPVVVLLRHQKYISCHLLIWQQADFINDLYLGRNIDENLLKRIVEVLTKVKFTHYKQSYRRIEDFLHVIGDKNLVFGISSNSKINFKSLEIQMLNKNWQFIYDGEFLKISDSNYAKSFSDFLNNYGIIFGKGTRPEFSLAKENICRDL